MAQISRPIPLASGPDSAGLAAGVASRLGSCEVAARLALPVLLALTAVLDLANLTISGFANTYYALAAQAGSQSWTALFFGSLDAANAVTLDKPPLAVVPMAIFVKLFGLSSLAILLPEALLGIATVAVLYLAVRRSFGEGPAFVAGLLTALTPVSVLIFRYDNPDALLTFLLVAAGYALVRGLDAGRLRWALLAAGLIGLGFLTKYLQAYLVLPAFALTWLLCAPVPLRRRIGGLLASLATVLLVSGWWVAIVELVPASARPYIGGSTNNSVLDLIVGYDGLGRILGTNPGAVGSGPGSTGAAAAAAASFSGAPGILRLFNEQMAGQIAWLLPAAVLGLAVGLVLYRRAGRTDRRLAGYVLWGGWLIGQGLVFSLMAGIIHAYYTVVLAPGIAALVAAGAWDLWTRRDTSLVARMTLALGIAGTGVLALALLDRTSGFAPGLGLGVVAVAGAAALVLALPAIHVDRRIATLAAGLALAAVLAGPAAYAAATIARAHSGGDALAGPTGDGNAGNGPVTTDQALVDYLVANQGSARWIVAVSGSPAAADIQLAAQLPVMAMGGFNGADKTPTLAQLQAYVHAGELRYVLLGGGPGGAGGFGNRASGPVLGGAVFGGPSGASGLGIAAWVSTACTPVTSGSFSGLYDCAGAA